MKVFESFKLLALILSIGKRKSKFNKYPRENGKVTNLIT